jgi:hypothetical protein
MERSLEDEKDAAIRVLTEDYARGGMDMAAFERAVIRIGASADRGALATEAAALGIAAPILAREAAEPARGAEPGEPPSAAIELACVSASLRKSGDWVKSRSYRLSLKSSSARLDLGAYAGARGMRLAIEVEAVSSSLRLIVPPGFEVEDGFAERTSSVVRNDPRGGEAINLVLLGGRLKSSTVKVKYLKAKPARRRLGRP